VTRTFGAAIGALIIVLFMAHIASRLVDRSPSVPRPQTALSRR
jgi:hypothetical protein